MNEDDELTEEELFELEHMNDHDLLLVTARDLKWMRRKVGSLCHTVYDVQVPKIARLEQKSASNGAVSRAKHNWLGYGFAALSLLISLIAIIKIGG